MQTAWRCCCNSFEALVRDWLIYLKNSLCTTSGRGILLRKYYFRLLTNVEVNSYHYGVSSTDNHQSLSEMVPGWALPIFSTFIPLLKLLKDFYTVKLLEIELLLHSSAVRNRRLFYFFSMLYNLTLFKII